MFHRPKTRTSVSLAVMLLFAAGAAGAQPAGGVARIAFVSATAFAPPVVKELEAALRDAGWVPGRNLTIDYRSADGDYSRLPALVADVLELKPQVILAGQTPTTQAIRKVTDAIPVVMIGHGDPIRYGIVTSFARPEGNTTGTAFLVNEVGVKLLELLKEALPGAGRVGFFVNPDNPGAAPLLDAARQAAPRLGLTIRPVEVRTPGELSRQLDALARDGVEALWLAPEAFLLTNRQQILDFALARRIPAVGTSPAYASAGALLTYSPHFPSLVRASARYVDRILRGARPRDLPVEQPSRFELIVNARTATTLGLTLAPALLLRADRVIE
jgi:putative ABC transport system substrate-binding protein